jgi:transcriptional regulator with XRE-family HTH domain
MDVGDRIRVIRTLKGFKQQYIAVAAGVSQGQISRIERGVAKPTFAEMVAIARVLQCPLNTFAEDVADHATSPRQ